MPARHSRRTFALAAGLVLAAAPATAQASSHRAEPTEPTSIAAPAPSDAAKDPQLRLTDIACPKAGDCFAVGTYHAKGGSQHGVLEHLVDGQWHATKAPEPVFADTDPKVELRLITCASADFCAAFGSYLDATDAPKRQALLVTYAATHSGAQPVWSGGRLVAPGGALASISAASCSPARTCIAVGSYPDGGVKHALLVTYHPRGWVTSDAPLPSPNVIGDPHEDSSLNAVDCPSGDVCFAVGNFHTTAGVHAGLLERHDSSGTWTPGRAQDAADAHSDPGTQLNAVSCPTKSYCVTGGRYVDSSTHQVGFLETWADAAWSGGFSAPVPTRGGTDPAMSLTSLSCASAGNCAAISELTDTHGHQVGALLRLADKHWHAVVTPLHGAASNPHVALTGLACGQVAVGTFTDAKGRTRPLLTRLGANGWTGQTGPLPTGAGKPATKLAAVACDPDGRAIAVGSYVDSAGRHRGMITRDAQA